MASSDEEYEEIEVEEEVEVDDDDDDDDEEEEEEEEEEEGMVIEVEVDDDDGQEIVEVEEEEDEDEEEYEEVEEEIEEEVEDDVEEEEIEEVVYEEVDEDENEEEEEEEEEDEEEDEEIVAMPAIEEERKAEIRGEPNVSAGDDDRNDTSIDLDGKVDKAHSRDPIALDSIANESSDIHGAEVIKHGCKSFSLHEKNNKGNGDEMHADVLLDAHALETIECNDRSSSLDEHNRKGHESPSRQNETLKIPKPHSYDCGTIDDKHEHVDKSIPVNVSKSDVDGIGGQMSKNKEVEIISSSLQEGSRGVELNHRAPFVEDMEIKASRSSTPMMRPRSPSMRAEHDDANKRPMIVCEYFVKGWCIKGSSCRFLHKRDHVDNCAQVVEGKVVSSKSCVDVDDSKSCAHLPSEVGICDNISPGSSLQKYTKLDRVKGIPDEKDKVVMSEKGVSMPFLSEDGSLSKGMGLTLGSLPNYCSPPYNDKGEPANRGRHYSMDGNSSPGFGSSTNISPLTSTSFPSKMTYQDMGWRTSSSGYLPLKEDVKDSLIYSKYKSKFTPYNWEPSVPFRPSFFIPLMSTSSAEVQYDPLRDSIEQSDVGNLQFHNSSDHRVSIFEDQSFSGRNSLGSQKHLLDDTWDKNYNGSNKDVALVEAQSAATCASDVQNRNILDEENPLALGSVKDMLKASRSITDVNSVSQGDGIGDHNEMYAEKGRKVSQLDEEESKVIKFFRSALIDFVKELMKPVWHEGRLSKDVYKVIVQKAEDKILSTLPSDKVPNTSESIKQYLSLSRPKILKLIQAYVDKYGKF